MIIIRLHWVSSSKGKITYKNQIYRECINCGKDRLWKDIFHPKTNCKYFFSKLKRLKWVSYIDLDEEREAEIDSCFSCDVDFHYLKSIEQF